MLAPFADAFTEHEGPTTETHVPEVVPIEELTRARIEAAEAEIEAEEEWPKTA
jgi:hypothetical protein